MRTSLMAMTVSATLATSIVTVSATAPAAGADPTWSACPDAKLHGLTPQFRCATIQVPRDYAQPTGAKIAVTVSKLPARVPSARRGVLVGNPGGPGGDGLGMFALLPSPAEIRDHYDLIAVQPRGLIGATPLRCVPPKQDLVGLLNGAGQLRQSCDRAQPGYARTISTENTARDIDSARSQLSLGSRINLLGISYGTTLMSNYATLFPEHTDRLILDSAVDPRTVWNSLLTSQTPGYQRRVQDLFAWIAANDATYHLGATPLAVYQRWSARVTAEAGVPPSVSPAPARVGDVPPALRGFADAYIRGVNVTGPARVQFENFVASLLTGKRQSSSTLLALTRAAAPSRNDWPRIAQRLVAPPSTKRPARPTSDELRATISALSTQNMVLCNENSVPAQPGLVPASLLDSLLINDILAGPGYLYSSGLGCSGIAPSTRPLAIANRGLAVTPLQLQSIGDPQTPYPGGLVAQQRMRAHLITVGGGDHGQYGRSNGPVDAAIAEYLRTGQTSVSQTPQAPITTPLLARK